MSNYKGKAINPKTKKIEDAIFLDDYFGGHKYGVQFMDGKDAVIYPIEDIITVTGVNP